MDADGNKTGGRKKGTPNKATAEVRTLASEYGPHAIKELARLAGFVEDAAPAQSDTARIAALGMLLDRSYGKALPARPIRIELPDASTPNGISKAVAAVVQATAGGELTPSEASDFCRIFDAQRRAIELSDIEARLAKLEEAAPGGRA